MKPMNKIPDRICNKYLLYNIIGKKKKKYIPKKKKKSHKNKLNFLLNVK
jgi:hypothetical protein